ncbi:MAG: glycosyl hydrolase [Acidimicrobiia bacterium]|nr:glycosyl hydrolase [Acidimicrobiia bacterium]
MRVVVTSPMGHRWSSGLLAVALLIVCAPSTAIAQHEPIHIGIYSDEWESGLDIRNLGVVGGAKLTFGGTFHRPGEGRANTLHILEQVWRAEATPVANLEIFSSSDTIASGYRDASIREWAGHVQAWLDRGEGRSLFIAPLAEMNGDWVPWGMDPESYPDAFRQVVTIFREMGMDETQVRWIWAPNSETTWPLAMTSFWPGSDYVDAVGVSAYNLGGDPEDWRSASESLHLASQVLRTVARDKPFLITQIGSSPEGGEKDEWISDMFDFVAADPNMIGFVYFNFDKEANWKVWDGFEAAPGWVEAVERHTVVHSWPLTDWFQPGPLTLDRVFGRERPEQPERATEPAFRGSDFIPGVYRGYLLEIFVGWDRPGPVPE